MSDELTTVQYLKGVVEQFVEERDWRNRLQPKDLTLGLEIEVAEIAEHFHFKNDAEIEQELGDAQKRREIGYEIADVLYYLLALSSKLGIDISQTFLEKMDQTEQRVPVYLAHGQTGKVGRVVAG
ncbi:MAG TPA: nucleotide pyrophosphohydrolase [Ktedonosporobacter sp.]|nr:nucleotide pyrophosphohydrolase [Ktedonosporobacter sp.]